MNYDTINVLQVVLGGKSFNGIASYLYQYYQHVDRSKVHFDFLFCQNNSLASKMNDPIFSDSEFYTLNANWGKTESTDYIKIFRGLKKILKDHPYDAVVVNTSVITAIAVCLLAAFPRKGRCFIAHAHNSGVSVSAGSIRKKLGPIINWVDDVCRWFLRKNCSYLFSCSNAAGCFTFGPDALKTDRFKIIRNAVDTQKFRYDPAVRAAVRTRLGTDPSITVYGNVGNLVAVKNHSFLLDIFSSIHNRQPNSELWIIGEGPEREKIETKIASLSLQGSVKLFGSQDNVNELLQAMDCFVFTSKREGLSIVSIEAQAAGLVTIVSDGVPLEAMVTELAYQIPLSVSADIWAEKILDRLQKTGSRRDMSSEITAAGYNVSDEADKMVSFFTSLN